MPELKITGEIAETMPASTAVAVRRMPNSTTVASQRRPVVTTIDEFVMLCWYDA